MSFRVFRTDRGASTVEFVLTMPLLLIIMLITVQFALIAHAQSGVQSAAEEGAARARAYDGSAGQAQAQAVRYVERLSGSLVSSVSVNVDRGQDQAAVTVSGSVTQIVPFIPTTIERTSAGPVERYVEEDQS